MLFTKKDSEQLEIREGSNKIIADLVLTSIMESMDVDEFNAFLESEECEAMQDMAILERSSVVKISKSSDLERRTKQAAIQLAKQKGTKSYANYKKYMDLANKAKVEIYKKNRSEAGKIAKVAQNKYSKLVSTKTASISGLKKAKSQARK